MAERVNIVLFRRDLRVADNPALAAALNADGPVICLFVHDAMAPRAPGGAARWWLHESIKALARRLEELGAPLVLRRGRQNVVVASMVEKVGAAGVFWNRRYAPHEIDEDRALKEQLEVEGVAASSYAANLLREPWETNTKTGGPYRVYTPFWKSLRAEGPSRDLAGSGSVRSDVKSICVSSDDLASWDLQPSKPNWAAEFSAHWTPGEAAAASRLDEFLGSGLSGYRERRDRPDIAGTSRLSPHLAFGEISPLQIWVRTLAAVDANPALSGPAEKFLSEIGWREFAYHLLYFQPEILEKPYREQFLAFPWRRDSEGLRRWQAGMTGYPIVDAGMRQLWRTGWMHNRVRMIVASFLTKHLLIPWQKGEEWFWDTLVDADIANNPVSWQWVAGSGADAAPYFRIFNPVAQGERFDPDGVYVREFVPELSRLPAKSLHRPWTATAEELASAGVRLGRDYPYPIVEHAAARERALEAFAAVKSA